jgi:hypothetical protein
MPSARGPRRSAPRACAPGPGSSSRSRDLHAARRARAPAGSAALLAGMGSRALNQGEGGDTFVRPRPPFPSSTGPSGSRCTAIAPRRGRTPISGSRPAPHHLAPRACAPGPASASRPRDLHAGRRARAPTGPAALLAGMGSRALNQGDGAETSSSAPALPSCRLPDSVGLAAPPSRRAAAGLLSPARSPRLVAPRPGLRARAGLCEPPT